MADEIKDDPFRGFLEALAGISMKLKLEEKIMEHNFKVGDNVMRKNGIEIWTICDILENGEQLECQSTFDGRVHTFFWKGLKLAPSIGDAYVPHIEMTTNPVTHEFICDELYETYKNKNKDYGDSFAQSLDKHGLIAAIVRMDDKMNRVINLNKADDQLVNDESVRDTLMDLANYVIMSVMWLDSKSGEECDGGTIYDIYADNQKLPGADYDGDTTNS